MAFQHLLLMVLLPLALGAAVFVYRRSFRAQLLALALGMTIHSLTVLVLEVLPQGGFDHHGNTWQGYLLISLGPYLLVLGSVALMRTSPPLQKLAAPAVVAASVPILYWVGLFVAVSVAVTAGLATP